MRVDEQWYDQYCDSHGIPRLHNRPEKHAKYGNSGIWVDGFYFPSGKEAGRYGDLKLLHRAKEIKGFCLQPVFLLTEGTGQDNRGTFYRADFGVKHLDNHWEIEDIKGIETPEFQLKLKMMKEKYPEIEIKIVR